jgi:hypothetical protein
MEEELTKLLLESIFSKPKNEVTIPCDELAIKVNEKLKGQEEFLSSMVNNPPILSGEYNE